MRAHTTAAVILLVSMVVGGCAPDGTFAPGGVNTAAIDQTGAGQMAKNDPMCATLAAEIETLNKQGVSDKVAKAAAKKYKMKANDLAKADELNKVNATFQAKCSSYPPNVAAAEPALEDGAPKLAARKPPVPTAKSVASAAAPPSTQAPAPAASPPSAQAPAAAAPQSAEAPAAPPPKSAQAPSPSGTPAQP